MSRLLVIIITLALGSASAYPQDSPPAESIMLELLDAGNTGDAEQLYETIRMLQSNPIDLNVCSDQELTETGLFTPFQVWGILEHRRKYGAFLTIYELAVIPGYSRAFVEQISSMLTCSPNQPASFSRQSQGLILSNIAIKNPPAAGYVSNDSTPAFFPGGPLKITQRASYSVNERIVCGLAYEKDAGEQMLNSAVPEHLAGYIQYKPKKLFRNIVIGNFRLHRGMGLVHGTGFMSGNGGLEINGYRRSYAKPFASTMEYDYLRGFYAEWNAGGWSSDFYVSYRQPDMSFFDFKSPWDLYEQIRKTGMHRTAGERNGTGLANLFSTGASFNKSGEHHYSGCAINWSRISLTGRGRDSLALQDALATSRTNLSAYSVGFWNRTEIFGELATDGELDFALIAGSSVTVNPAFAAVLAVRYYQPDYTGQLPRAHGSGDDPENSRGINLGLNITPFERTRVSIHTDLSGHINITGSDELPGWRNKLDIRLTHGTRSEQQWVIRLTGKEKEMRNSSGEMSRESFFTQRKSTGQLQYSGILSGQVRISGRCIVAILRQDKEKYKSWVVCCQARWKPSDRLQMIYRYQLFDAVEWENRIYIYEPGLRYSFSFPAVYGNGQRNNLIAALRIDSRMTLRSKFGVTKYAHRRKIGSGQDARPGNMLLDLEFQFQVKLY